MTGTRNLFGTRFIGGRSMTKTTGTPLWQIILAWSVVAVPFLWGVVEAMKSAIHLFAP